MWCKIYGENADGLAPKLGVTNTVFNYCYAWENSDDGWDSFDKEGDNSSFSIIYIQLVGIMVIQMFLLGNVIMIMVRLWIKIYGLCNNWWVLVVILKKIIMENNLVLIMVK